jgi:hypothetical protein
VQAQLPTPERFVTEGVVSESPLPFGNHAKAIQIGKQARSVVPTVGTDRSREQSAHHSADKQEYGEGANRILGEGEPRMTHESLLTFPEL